MQRWRDNPAALFQRSLVQEVREGQNLPMKMHSKNLCTPAGTEVAELTASCC